MSSKTKEESLGTVSKTRAIMIFEALGFGTAEKWDIARLQKKLTKLHTLIEGADLDSKTQKRVNEILRVQSKGRDVVVVDSDKAAETKRIGKEVKAAAEREVTRKAEKRLEARKKAEKASNKKAKETEAAKKQEKRIAAKSKKTAKKVEAKKEDKKPGVIMSVLEFVKTHGPVSEKKILSLLKKRFPDRDPGSMGRSIPKIPGHLRSTKNMDVIGKNDKGQYHIK